MVTPEEVEAGSVFYEPLGECLTARERKEYGDFATRLRQIESSDYVYAEQASHEEWIRHLGYLIEDGIEGADVIACMIADHRRRRDLCAQEIQRRSRLGKYPPSGKRFADFSEARQQVRSGILEIIRNYVALTKRGREWKGLCPFHDDHHASLSVNAEKLVWFCPVCGTGGDAFDFLARAEGLKHAAQ